MDSRINSEKATYWIIKYKGKRKNYVCGDLAYFCGRVGLDIFTVRRALSQAEVIHLEGWEIMRFTNADLGQELEDDGFVLRPETQKVVAIIPVKKEFQTEDDITVLSIFTKLQTLEEEENARIKAERKAARMGKKQSE
jgi:hypothetical protein